MIRALEIYDSFNPRRLLEVRFVVYKGNGEFYDLVNRQEGFSLTGRTFRSSYASLREFYHPPEKEREDENEWTK